MASQLQTFSTLTYASVADQEALGQPSHQVQMQVWAVVPSKTEFARLLISEHLASGDTAKVVRQISPYLNNPRHRDDLEPGVLYIRALNAHPSSPFIRADSIQR